VTAKYLSLSASNFKVWPQVTIDILKCYHIQSLIYACHTLVPKPFSAASEAPGKVRETVPRYSCAQQVVYRQFLSLIVRHTCSLLSLRSRVWCLVYIRNSALQNTECRFLGTWKISCFWLLGTVGLVWFFFACKHQAFLFIFFGAGWEVRSVA
jgi:hypothetical protein